MSAFSRFLPRALKKLPHRLGKPKDAQSYIGNKGSAASFKEYKNHKGIDKSAGRYLVKKALRFKYRPEILKEWSDADNVTRLGILKDHKQYIRDFTRRGGYDKYGRRGYRTAIGSDVGPRQVNAKIEHGLSKHLTKQQEQASAQATSRGQQRYAKYQSLKKKARKNIAIQSGIGAGLLGVGATGYGVHKHRKNKKKDYQPVRRMT